MKRAINDATLTRLGDIFQYYIALLECFKMEEGDSILIEVKGDISKVSVKNSFQMEVKHHLKPSSISDRNIEIWNTIDNWIKEFDLIKDVDKLLLYTTSGIQTKSVFNNWSSKSNEEKYEDLKKVGSEKKAREKLFRELYDCVFPDDNSCEDKLRSIIAKFEIKDTRSRITSINNDFKEYLRLIPKSNREKFIASLLGNILSKVKDEPHIWEVTYEYFEELLQMTTPNYTNSKETPLPTEFEQLELPLEVVDRNTGKRFVQVIKAIDYDSEIPEAIGDYWKTNMTIAKYYTDNILFNSSLSQYTYRLSQKLLNCKKPLIIDNDGSSRDTQIKNSKKFYSSVMAWDATPFSTVNPNFPFFQKGTIHNHIDTTAFTWDVGDKS
ncbi:hypothetical protein MH117_04150 [Paenibacillus sp. ACRRX]|uniref:hypothetical protein n=1 Tax=Paenibacillus sp. ACRRX TaxID=2918206 RepID=UPI000FA8AD1F|nr:hypothetical protein [Paenibacillus sp. ACRRX]MCG7406599.1 hypothetical protein [Paenibacillus sp. ACRRX]